MQNFTNFLQEKLVPIANKFANIPFISVMRNSVIVLIPLMIVGAFGTFITNIPFPAVAAIVEPAKPFFDSLISVTTGISGLFVSITIGYYAAKQYDITSINGISASMCVFLVTTLSDEFVIDVSNFGASGMFTAIVIGYLSVYIVHLCKKFHIEIKMPESVPSMVASTFSLILALFISVSIFLTIKIGLKFDINQAIMTMVSPLANGLNTLPGLLLYAFFTTLLFICGINPAVIVGLLVPVIMMSQEANTIAVASGQLPTHFTTWGMYSIMTAGGTGGTIGLALLYLFSKSKTQRKLGKIFIVPALFNINEPIIYGVPIMFNPILMIPFIITPLVNISLTWFLMSSNIIGRAFVEIPWSTPQIINGFLMSGGDLRTMLWTGVVVIISITIYYPFFKILEKQELDKEANMEG